MIEAQNLSKHYKDKLAVDDLSFTVAPGKVTGFLGPNGAGKSTTMRLLLGLDRPDAGSASICGKPYRDLVLPMRVAGALLEAQAVHKGRSAYNHLLCLAQETGRRFFSWHGPAARNRRCAARQPEGAASR
jgi:ABC-2 type transport system ATP-binding protein